MRTIIALAALAALSACGAGIPVSEPMTCDAARQKLATAELGVALTGMGAEYLPVAKAAVEALCGE